jgi:hypothetical protein
MFQIITRRMFAYVRISAINFLIYGRPGVFNHTPPRLRHRALPDTHTLSLVGQPARYSVRTSQYTTPPPTDGAPTTIRTQLRSRVTNPPRTAQMPKDGKWKVIPRLLLTGELAPVATCSLLRHALHLR